MADASGTLTVQKTTSVLSSGDTQYTVYALFSAPVTITDDGVFLYQIVDEAVPSSDTFTRTCTVGDVGTYERTRAAAISAGDAYYRSAALTRNYTDLDTAVLAQTAITEQVSALLDAWTTADTSYFGTDITAVPTGATTVLQSAINLAEAAHEDYLTAVAAEAAALVAKNSATASQTLLQSVVGSLTPIQVEAAAAATNIATAESLSELAETQGISDSINTSFTTFWTYFANSNAQLSSYEPYVDSVSDDLTSLLSTLNSDLTSANSSVSSTTSTYVSAQAATAAALTLREDLADDVRAIDPTYTFSWE